MFLFEKSLKGAYCNRLHDLKESHSPISCYGRIKANTAGKSLNITNINTKAGPPNRRTCHHQTAHFFNCQNDHHLGDAINFDYVLLPPPLTLLKITNGSSRHRFLILNTSSLH